LKRRRWIGESNGALTARRALLCSVAMLKKALSDEEVQVAGFSSVSGISRLLGCTALYVPSHGYEATVNRERNAGKIIALRTAKANRATVKLLAETGNSFLHFRGAFYPEIEALLEFGKLEIVLANPCFVESHGISAAYKDRANVDDAGLHSLLKQKFEESFSGYRSLRSQAGPRIQARIARYAISSTLLMTDEEIFFEPYFRSDRSRRHRRLFETFELRFSARNEHVRKLSNEHFEFHWKNSDPLETDMEFRDRYLAILAEVTEMWQGA
jgi:hypothetical protein